MSKFSCITIPLPFDCLSESIDKYKPANTDFLVDDGSENNNKHVHDLLKLKSEQLIKLIAQKDISFSNSMVEALNKTVKNNYLRMMNIYSQKMLIEMVDFVVHDFNVIRPHYSLLGNTPIEVFEHRPWDKSVLSNQMILAKEQRIAHNKKNRCKTCL